VRHTRLHVLAGTAVTAALTLAVSAAPASAASMSEEPDMVRVVNVAHRGSSAEAPENTLAAFRLGIEQGSDLIESDVQRSRDGALVLMHDTTLTRTTDVEQVFPDRSPWRVSDFTLAEIKRLDAGSWFDPKFAGERVLSWEEAVQIVKGRAGMYPELKAPSLYAGRGIDMVALVARAIREAGFDEPSEDNRPPLILQSFDPDALRALASALPAVPRVQLIDRGMASRWATPEGLKEVATFASGIGPAKAILEERPTLVETAHGLGLTVTPYTFRSSATGRHTDVTAEMRHFLFELGVDAVFTDNPDRFPR
jgi:glycerophosphoryl diester phosphodiesterase